MLYISNLKSIIKFHRYSLKEISELIGLTDSGFHLALKNNTLKVRDLEKIAEILEIDICDFFKTEAIPLNQTIKQSQKGTGNTINTGVISDGGKFNKVEIKLQREVENLKKDVKQLKTEVKGLEKEVELKDEIIILLKK